MRSSSARARGLRPLETEPPVLQLRLRLLELQVSERHSRLFPREYFPRLLLSPEQGRKLRSSRSVMVDLEGIGGSIGCNGSRPSPLTFWETVEC